MPQEMFEEMISPTVSNFANLSPFLMSRSLKISSLMDRYIIVTVVLMKEPIKITEAKYMTMNHRGPLEENLEESIASEHRRKKGVSLSILAHMKVNSRKPKSWLPKEAFRTSLIDSSGMKARAARQKKETHSVSVTAHK